MSSSSRAASASSAAAPAGSPWESASRPRTRRARACRASRTPRRSASSGRAAPPRARLAGAAEPGLDEREPVVDGALAVRVLGVARRLGRPAHVLLRAREDPRRAFERRQVVEALRARAFVPEGPTSACAASNSARAAARSPVQSRCFARRIRGPGESSRRPSSCSSSIARARRSGRGVPASASMFERRPPRRSAAPCRQGGPTARAPRGRRDRALHAALEDPPKLPEEVEHPAPQAGVVAGVGERSKQEALGPIEVVVLELGPPEERLGPTRAGRQLRDQAVDQRERTTQLARRRQDLDLAQRPAEDRVRVGRRT